MTRCRPQDDAPSRHARSPCHSFPIVSGVWAEPRADLYGEDRWPVKNPRAHCRARDRLATLPTIGMVTGMSRKASRLPGSCSPPSSGRDKVSVGGSRPADQRHDGAGAPRGPGARQGREGRWYARADVDTAIPAASKVRPGSPILNWSRHAGGIWTSLGGRASPRDAGWCIVLPRARPAPGGGPP
jgi:hypothetical protein